MNRAVAMPSAIENAMAVLRLRLADFVLPNLARHIEKLQELRKAAPDDVFFTSLDEIEGDELIPILSEPLNGETGGVLPVAPFNLSLPREAALAFVNLLCHTLFLEGLAASAGFVNVRGRGFMFRITGVDATGEADVSRNELFGELPSGGVA